METTLYIAQFRQRCIEQDRKATANRLIIARSLYRYGDYVDAVSLYMHIRQADTISISTVYLVLNLLVDIGLANIRMNEEGKKVQYKWTMEGF